MTRNSQKKNKSKQNKRRKTNKPRRRSRKGKGNMMNIHPAVSRAVHQVCSNYDPFCQAAIGAKQFDNNTMPSLTYQNRQIVAVVTDAAGYAAIWFNGTPTAYLSVATISGGLATAWTPSDSNFYSTITATGLSQWRIVSSGLRYYTTEAWTTATGYMNITELTQTYGGVTGQAVGSLRLGPIVKTVPLRDAQITYICRSKGMKSKEYQEATQLDSGYTGCFLYFAGTPNTTIGILEFNTNYEWTADPNSSYQYFSSPAADHKPLILDAVTTMSTINSNIKTFTGGVESAASFMSEAKAAVNKVAGLIEDVGAIGGMISPSARVVTGGAHALRLLTN